MAEKSAHKHAYELVKIKEPNWFTHEKVCKICRHVYDRVRISDKARD
ncbi:MAG: hypothetical protein ACQEXV_24070 [Bacillota bacterium]